LFLRPIRNSRFLRSGGCLSPKCCLRHSPRSLLGFSVHPYVTPMSSRCLFPEPRSPSLAIKDRVEQRRPRNDDRNYELSRAKPGSRSVIGINSGQRGRAALLNVLPDYMWKALGHGELRRLCAMWARLPSSRAPPDYGASVSWPFNNSPRYFASSLMSYCPFSYA